MTIQNKENKLFRKGRMYNDSSNSALTYKHTKTNKKFVWRASEKYSEFVDRCFNFLNEDKKSGGGTTEE